MAVFGNIATILDFACKFDCGNNAAIPLLFGNIAAILPNILYIVGVDGIQIFSYKDALHVLLMHNIFIQTLTVLLIISILASGIFPH